MIDIDVSRLLVTCERFGCDEIWLMPGQSPLMRVSGELRQINAAALDDGRAEQIAKALIPDVLKTWFEQNGYVSVHCTSHANNIYDVLIFRVSDTRFCFHFKRKLS